MEFKYNSESGEVTIQFKAENQKVLGFLNSRVEDIKSYLMFSYENHNYTMSYQHFTQNAYLRRIADYYIYLKREIPNLEVFWDEALTIQKSTFNHIVTEMLEQQEQYDLLISGGQTKELNMSMFKSSFKPFAFQEEHAKFICANKRVSDFSSPGAGKTIIGYMAIASMMAEKEINSIVVVGPKTAAVAWLSEWNVVFDEKNVNPRNSQFDYSNKKMREIDDFSASQFISGKLNVFFVNYHKLDDKNFVSKLLTKLSREKFAFIIDEAHYIKNIKGERHKSAVDISWQAKATLILTGTPIPRDLKETYFVINSLWPMVNHGILAEDQFSKSESFNFDNEHFISTFKNTFVRKNKASLVATGELKPLFEHEVKIEKTKVEQFLWDNMPKSKFDAKLLEKWDRAILVRMMQAASYPPLLEQSLRDSIEELRKDILGEDEEETNQGDDKEQFNNLFEHGNKKLEEQIDALIRASEIKKIIDDFKFGREISKKWIEAKNIMESHDERFIVWDIFRKSMDAFEMWVKKQFPNRKVIKINGTVTKEKREQAIAAFRYHSNAILIASPATIAESLSLHRECHKAIYLNKNFVGSQWMQSKDRIHRLVKPGEKSFVKNIYYINAKDSIDEQIHNNLKSKEAIQNQIIDK